MNLTTKQLTQIFDVDTMTVYNWRNPSKHSQKTPLPFHTEKFGEERHKVHFVWSETKTWAKKNKVEIVVHPKDLNTLS